MSVTNGLIRVVMMGVLIYLMYKSNQRNDKN
jgi:preprotein translocase subunit YajC